MGASVCSRAPGGTRSFIAVASLLFYACTPNEHIAHVSDAYVVASGNSGGAVLFQPKPIEGKPLANELTAPARCTPAADLLSKLGPACSHESENPAPSGGASTVDDLEPGKPTRTRQIRWYCGGELDVRVVFEPCDTNGDGRTDGVVPVEVAVAIHRGK